MRVDLLRVRPLAWLSDALLRRLDPPRCSECNELLTVSHIPLGCPGYDHFRQRYQLRNELASLLDDDNDVVRMFLLFVRETGLCPSS